LFGPDRSCGVLAYFLRTLTLDSSVADIAHTFASLSSTGLCSDLLLDYMSKYLGEEIVDDLRPAIGLLMALLGYSEFAPSTARERQKLDEDMSVFEPFVRALDVQQLSCLMAVVPPGQCNVLRTFVSSLCQVHDSKKAKKVKCAFDTDELEFLTIGIQQALVASHPFNFSRGPDGRFACQLCPAMESTNIWLMAYIVLMIVFRATGAVKRFVASKSGLPCVNFGVSGNDLKLEAVSKFRLTASLKAGEIEEASTVHACVTRAGVSDISSTGVITEYMGPYPGARATKCFAVCLPLDIFTTKVMVDNKAYKAVVKNVINMGKLKITRSGTTHELQMVISANHVKAIHIRAFRSAPMKDGEVLAFGAIVISVNDSCIAPFRKKCGFLRYIGDGGVPAVVNLACFDSVRKRLNNTGTDVRPTAVDGVSKHRAPTIPGDCGSPLHFNAHVFGIHCGSVDSNSVFCNFFVHLPNIDPVPSVTDTGADETQVEELEAKSIKELKAAVAEADELLGKFRATTALLAVRDNEPVLTVVRQLPAQKTQDLKLHITAATHLTDMVDVIGGHEEICLAGLSLAAQPREVHPLPSRERKWAKCVATVVSDMRKRFEHLGFEESIDQHTPWQIMSMFRTSGSGRELADMLQKTASFPTGATNSQIISTIHAWFSDGEPAHKVVARNCVEILNAEIQKGWNNMDRGSPALMQYVFPKREPVKLSKMLQGSTRIIVSSFIAYTRMLRRSHWVGNCKSTYCGSLKPGEQRRLTWDQLLALDISKDPASPFGYLNLGRPYDQIQANAHKLYSTGRAVSADVTGWDRNLPPVIITSLFETIYGGAVAAKWTKQLCGGGLYNVGQSIVKFTSSDVVLWPSGNVNTLLGNSIIHAGLLISCGYPRDKFMVQGDDVVCCPADGKAATVAAHYKEAGFGLKKVDDGPGQDFCGLPIASADAKLIDPIKILSKMLARVDGSASPARRMQIAQLLNSAEEGTLRTALTQVAIEQFGLTHDELAEARPIHLVNLRSTTGAPETTFVMNKSLQICGLEGRYKNDYSGESNHDDDDDEIEFDYADPRHNVSHQEDREDKHEAARAYDESVAYHSGGLVRPGSKSKDFESYGTGDRNRFGAALAKADAENGY
jgi:hypothetical protein